jgi:hypothetical protein
MTEGFRCFAYDICNNLHNARGGCEHLASISYDKTALSAQQQFDELSHQLVSMQACLISIVLLLSEIERKESP